MESIAVSIIIIALIVNCACWILRLKYWYRRRKVERRIKRQAVALGVWGNPQVLGGRALDIYAREECGLTRWEGEPDHQLRKRVYEAFEENRKIERGNRK